MDWQYYIEEFCDGLVSFSGKNKFCNGLARAVLWIGWGTSSIPAAASELYPRTTRKVAIRLGAACLAILLVLLLIIGGIVFAVTASGRRVDHAPAIASSASSSASSESNAAHSSSSAASSRPAPSAESEQTPIPPKSSSSSSSSSSPFVSAGVVQPTVQVTKPAAVSTSSKAAGPVCNCTRKCDEDSSDDNCPVCKDGYRGCTYEQKIKSLSDLYTLCRTLEKWYDKQADSSGKVDEDGCIKNKTNRNQFIKDFEAIQEAADHLADQEEDAWEIYDQLEENRTYQRLEELYDLMRDYKENASSSSSSSSSSSGSSSDGSSGSITLPKQASTPVCASVVDAGGHYNVYANGTPITLSADGSGTKISWSGGSRTYNSGQQDNLIVFGGYESASLTGGTSITMTGGTVKAIFGGGNWQGGVSGSASVRISGGTVLTDVYGGGASSGAGVGSADVSVTGGTIKGNLFGGGQQGRINGDVSVTLSGNASIGTAGDPSTGYVLARGYRGTVTGNRTVKVQGSPTVTSGIDLSTVTSRYVEITGALSGGAIPLINPAIQEKRNETVVAKAKSADFLKSIKQIPFSLATSKVAVVPAGGTDVRIADYSLLLDNGQNNGASTPIVLEYGTDEFPPKTLPVPEFAGHTFIGYYSAPTGASAALYNEKGVKAAAWTWPDLAQTSVTLYARWTQNQSVLTVDPQNGTEALTFTGEALSRQLIPEPEKENCLFSHWEMEGGNGLLLGSVYQFGPQAEPVLLTAQWIESQENALTAEVDNSAAPEIEVAGLARLFEVLAETPEEGVTASDLDDGNEVRLTMTVSPGDEEENEAAALYDAAGGEQMTYYDFEVAKTVTPADGEPEMTELSELPVPVELSINLTGNLAGLGDYAVYRYHDGTAEPISPDETAEEFYTLSPASGPDGEDQLLIRARKFSVYAVAGYSRAPDPGAGSTAGSGPDAAGGSHDVHARIAQGDEAVYKLDLSWGAMKFSYATGNAWNASTHRYDGPAVNDWLPEGFDGVNNRLTAVNHSNGDLLVSFQVTANLLTDTIMELYASNDKTGSTIGLPLGKVPAVGAAAPELDAFLWLTGKPAGFNSTSYSKVGVITVTVEAVEGDRTPGN